MTCSAAARTAAGAFGINSAGAELGAAPGLDERAPPTWIWIDGSAGNGAGARFICEVCVWVIIDESLTGEDGRPSDGDDMLGIEGAA
jgi:hypothetical protein